MEEQQERSAIDDYIAKFPEDVRDKLSKIRAVISAAAPGAKEKMGYGMPGIYTKRGLVWFGAHKGHIGFYPTPEGMEAFQEELAAYRQSKGAVQFPLDQPIPYDLIGRIAKFRFEQESK